MCWRSNKKGPIEAVRPFQRPGLTQNGEFFITNVDGVQI